MKGSALRQHPSDLSDIDRLLWVALAASREALTDDLAAEAAVPLPDLRAVAAASNERILLLRLLRSFALPPLAHCCDGPDEAEELQLLREAC
jgi:hypothetical protein